MNKDSKTDQIAHRKGSELSTNQNAVMSVLEQEEGPISAYMILDKLRDSGFRAPLQVYRALEKLTALGKVHRLESLNAYIACNHISCTKNGATAFMICEDCEHVIEVSDIGLSSALASLSEKTAFQASRSSIELHGLCDHCAETTSG